MAEAKCWDSGLIKEMKLKGLGDGLAVRRSWHRGVQNFCPSLG